MAASGNGRVVNDYHGVDTTSQSFGQIIDHCEEACNRIINLQNQLKECFTGDAADQWNTQISQLLATAREYRSDLGILKQKIQTVSGYGGVIQDMDKQQGQRFLSAY